jgi:hypothetical protein
MAQKNLSTEEQQFLPLTIVTNINDMVAKLKHRLVCNQYYKLIFFINALGVV